MEWEHEMLTYAYGVAIKHIVSIYAILNNKKMQKLWLLWNMQKL